MTMNWLGTRGFFKRVDDTLGIFHTHAVAGALGGIMTGILADPNMAEYVGIKSHPNVAVAGLAYGNPHQLLVQIFALLVIVAYDGLATWGVLKLVGMLVPLRLPQLALEVGDRAIHGEVAYEDDDDEPKQSRLVAGWSLKPEEDPDEAEIDA